MSSHRFAKFWPFSFISGVMLTVSRDSLLRKYSMIPCERSKRGTWYTDARS